jgi:hypothetical protein
MISAPIAKLIFLKFNLFFLYSKIHHLIIHHSIQVKFCFRIFSRYFSYDLDERFNSSKSTYSFAEPIDYSQSSTTKPKQNSSFCLNHNSSPSQEKVNKGKEYSNKI